MHTIEAVRRLIRKKGIDNAIAYLSEDTNEERKLELTKCGIFVDGFLNLSLLYSLM